MQSSRSSRCSTNLAIFLPKPAIDYTTADMAYVAGNDIVSK